MPVAIERTSTAEERLREQNANLRWMLRRMIRQLDSAYAGRRMPPSATYELNRAHALVRRSEP